MVEVLDQTNGNGGHILFVNGGVNNRNITIYISPGNTPVIGFLINIYGEQPQPKHFIDGHLTETSQLIFS